MAEIDERALLLASLKGYLEELKESGVDELPFGVDETPAAAPSEAPKAEAGTVTLDGVGNHRARLLFVMAGEGFEGEGGSLLARIIIAMGFAPEDVFLLSFPRNHAAADKLREALMERISKVSPEVVVALGETAAQLLTGSRDPISTMRGRFIDIAGRSLMATLHPDELVSDESLKRQVWNEMKQVMALLARK